jgi:hypothetical protein
LKIAKRCPNFWATFYLGKVDELILTKMGWVIFWAIFSQTHLVTLPFLFLCV